MCAGDFFILIFLSGGFHMIASEIHDELCMGCPFLEWAEPKICGPCLAGPNADPPKKEGKE